MPIALGLNPVWTKGTATSIVSAAFSPVANSLIIVESHVDAATSPTITDSVGLTWTAIGTPQAASTGGRAAAWWAFTASARTNMTVTVGWSTAANKAIKVKTWTGTASVSAVISKAQNVSTTSPLNIGVTTTNDGCRISGSALDWNARGAPTSTDDEVSDTVTNSISFTSVHKAANSSGVGTSVTLNIVKGTVNPSAADWGYKVWEIVPAAGGTTDVAGSDTGSGTDDTATLDVDLAPATDTSSMVEAATLTTLTPKSGSDTALTVDAGTLLASFSGTEAGGSVDAPSGPLSATLTGAEAPGSVEAYQLSVVLQSADTGAQTDAGSVAQGATNKSGSETATAVDAATLAASQSRADTAGAADVATLVVNFTASDLSSIVDTVQALAAAHTGADTSSETEGQTVNAGGNVSGGDISPVTEGRTLTVSLTGADTSTTTDNQTVLPTTPQSGSDIGSTVENRTLTVQLTASEIVAAIEGFSLSAGGNPAGTDAGAMVEQIQLLVQVTGSDGVTTIDQGFLTLLKSGAETSTLVESAALLAKLTVAEVVAAAEVLAVLTGPQVWKFISADVRTVTNGHEANSSKLPGIAGGTRIDISVTW